MIGIRFKFAEYSEAPFHTPQRKWNYVLAYESFAPVSLQADRGFFSCVKKAGSRRMRRLRLSALQCRLGLIFRHHQAAV